MKILAFSDLHLSSRRAAVLVEASKEADLVIGAGDFCNGRQGLHAALQLLAGIKPPMVVVPGNAESAAELRAAALDDMTVLHGEAMLVEGISIFGLGYAVPETPFGAWSCDLSEAEAGMLLDRCRSARILVTHSPPKGVADETSSGLSVGSTAIRAAIERLQPEWALCGHIHDSWGMRGEIGKTQVANLGPFPTLIEVSND